MSKEVEILREHIRTHRTVLSMCGEPEDVILNRLLDDFESNENKIAELEAKLTESEEKINMLEEHKFYADNINQAYADKCKNYEKQLAEKEKEIDNLYNRLNSKQKFYEMNIEKDYKEYLSRLNKLEKECDKDKISFAVEQLEKARSNILCNEKFYFENLNKHIDEQLDNQIKQLKEK